MKRQGKPSSVAVLRLLVLGWLLCGLCSSAPVVAPTITLSPTVGPEICEQELAFGKRNGDECYSVDSITCQTKSSHGGCVTTTTAQGTYDYYLAKNSDDGGYPRVTLWTVLVSATFQSSSCGTTLTITNPSSSSCQVTVEDHNHNQQSFPYCQVLDDGEVEFVITSQDHPRAAGIFQVGTHSIYLRKGGGYLKLRKDPDHCDYLFASDAPSFVSSSGGPSIGPSLVPSTIQSSNAPSIVYTNCYQEQGIPGFNVDDGTAQNICYNVDINVCTTELANGCVEMEATYDYGQGNPTIQVMTSVGCGVIDDYCQISIGPALICNRCKLEILPCSPPNHCQRVTMQSECALLLNNLVQPIDQTIWISEAVGFILLAEDQVVCPSGGPSIVPSTWPSMAAPSITPSIVPSSASCYHEEGIPSFGVDDDDCYDVDIHICTTVVGNCVETEAIYNYGDGNPTITVATSVGCGFVEDYCHIAIGALVCNRCRIAPSPEPNLSQEVTMPAACAPILNDLVKDQEQTILLSEAVGYFRLAEEVVVCPPPTVYPTPSMAPSFVPPSSVPSFIPSYVDTQQPTTAQSEFPSGGYFSCYDMLAEGQVKNGDCYAVDIGICTEQYGNNCIRTYASYSYYNSEHVGGYPRDNYNYVSISTVVNCAGQDDYCSTSSCNACHVVEDTVALMGCSASGLSPSDQFVTLAEGGGYPTLEHDEEKCNHPAIVGSTIPSTVPTIMPSPSSPISILARSGAGIDIHKKATKVIVMTLKPHFTFVFFPGHTQDEPPEATQILILLERTESYIRKVLAAEALMSIHLDDVRQDYKVHPQHELELSFVAKLTFDAAGNNNGIKTTVVADLLANAHNLNDYVGRHARFADEDGTLQNGLLFYTHKVRARIAGSRAVYS